MNRIEQLGELANSLAADLSEGNYSVDLAQFTVAEATACHTFFAPMHYEPGYAYPLIVWLHGAGDNERQLRRIMPLVSMRNYVAVAPQATDAIDADTEKGGYRWRQSEDHIMLAEQRVMAALAAADEKFHVAPSRVFIAGYEDGGTMALRIAMNHPELFAGALTLGGPFPSGHRPLGRINEVRNLPLFLASGTASERYPQTRVCQDLRLFHSAGLSVTLRQYPCGDELTTLMLADMNRWIMQQVCPEGSCDSNATDSFPNS